MSLYYETLQKFGRKHQINKAVEELVELATVLIHFRDEKATMEEVASEIADVEIVVSQMRLLISPDILLKAKMLKLERLESLVR
jgi:hypothetical protein